MKTVNQIYSQVVTATRDEAHQMLGKAVYVDAIQRTLEDLASECHAWQQKHDFIVGQIQPDANPQATIAINGQAFPTQDVISVPDYILRTFGSQNATATTLTLVPLIDPLHRINIPATFTPWYLLRVLRNDRRCAEVTYESIDNVFRLNPGYRNNDVKLTELHYGAKALTNGTLDIIFDVPFDTNERITIEYVSRKPTDVTTITMAFSVPDWVYEAMVCGTKAKIFRMLHERTDGRLSEEWLRKANAAETYYSAPSGERWKATNYSRMLYEKNTAAIIQPMKWLPDYGAVYY